MTWYHTPNSLNVQNVLWLKEECFTVGKKAPSVSTQDESWRKMDVPVVLSQAAYVMAIWMQIKKDLNTTALLNLYLLIFEYTVFSEISFP